MAAAFIAQMCSEEFVVQLKLMHADLSRGLRDNEAEHQRLWETVEETTSDVGNLGGMPSKVQHVLDGTTDTARQVPSELLERRRRPGPIRAMDRFHPHHKIEREASNGYTWPKGSPEVCSNMSKSFQQKENGCGLLKSRSSTMLEG